MNIITKIQSDHQEIRHLIKKVDSVLNSLSKLRDSQFQKLKSLVLIHHDCELSTLLSELAKYDKSKEKALHLVEEHGEHKKVIDQMDSIHPETKDWIDRYKELRHDILHHIEEEENVLFPLIMDTLDEETQIKLGHEMVLASAKSVLKS